MGMELPNIPNKQGVESEESFDDKISLFAVKFYLVSILLCACLVIKIVINRYY